MGKVVFITGASRGIGASTAIKFAQNNYNIILNYYKEDKKAEELKELLEKKYSVKVLLMKGDISSEQEVKTMLYESLKHFSKIDVLVNNAGIAIDQELEDKDIQTFQKVLNINLIGTFLMCKYVGLEMYKQKQGKIINVSSTNGIDTVYPQSMDYDASKAGVISLTHNFAKQFAPYIHVNAIAPGWVNTDMNQELSPIFKEEELKKILLERFANPEEIASVIYFLASNEASYINDTIIRIDGGVNH